MPLPIAFESSDQGDFIWRLEQVPDIIGPEALEAVTRACDAHMDEWGPKTQPDFPVNFYANRYTPLLSDPALQALPTIPSVLTAAVQLLRSTVRHKFVTPDTLSLALRSRLSELVHRWSVGTDSQDIKLSPAQLTYKFSQKPGDPPVFPDGDGRTYRNWHRDLNNFGKRSPPSCWPLCTRHENT